MGERALCTLAGVMAIAVIISGCIKKTPEQKVEDISDHMARTLDMTDVQLRRMDIIKNDILKKRNEVYNSQLMERVQHELSAQLHKERFDAAGFEKFKEGSLDKQEEFISYLGEKLAEAHSVLSPPQREKLAMEIERNRDIWFGAR